MFHPLMSLFIAVLFFVLTPGIFLSLPAGSSFRMKAMFHAVVFALIYHLTHKMVWHSLYGGYEGFLPIPSTGMKPMAGMQAMPGMKPMPGMMGKPASAAAKRY